MVVLLTGQHSCGILTHRINGGAADGSAFLRQTEELASRPPLRNLWISFFLMFSIL